MQNFSERFRVLHFVLSGTLLLYALPTRALGVQDGPKTSNVGFKVIGQEVEIYYDLIAPEDRVYKITLLLKRRFDRTFVHTPLRVSGDIGPAVSPGESKRISWVLSDEFPKGLPGEDCFFTLSVEPGGPAGGKISPIIWIAGGAVVLGGILVAVLSGSKGTGGGGGGNGAGFPPPPARP